MKNLTVKLSLEERATKEALYQIYTTAKFGLGGHFVVLLIITSILSGKVPLTIIASGFILHTLILSWRAYTLFQYKKNIHTVTDTNSINHWIRLFKIGAFMTGSAWGITLFFLPDLSAEYHFFIFAVLVALPASGIVTLGVIFSIYNAFMLSILGGNLIWMLLQDGLLYSVAALSTAILIFYYFASARRFSQNFKQAFIEKETTKEYVIELKNEYAAFETLFEKSSDALLIIKDGKFVQCNEKSVEMLHYNCKDDLLNAHPAKFSPEFQPD
ncbi:MAG: PAS domain-containing protein, partial [Thiotrichaceae bacterium]|nr:PAS domain-containing protein [Thiotrichaceae bacterium]